MKKALIVLAHAAVLWALCGATMMLGMAVFGESTAIIIHMIAAPIYAALVMWNYTKRFHYTTPLNTAIIFTSFIMILDSTLVAGVFIGSYEMFENIYGTWIPFALIFLATYLTGIYMTKEKK